MTLYHLHARLYRGQLGDPDSEYLFQSRDTDNYDEVTRAAKELAGRGFDVVIYDHGRQPLISGASDYRQIAKYYPDGRVEVDAEGTPEP